MPPQTSKTPGGPVKIRPSSRLLKPWYYLGFISIALAFGYNNNRTDELEWWIFVPPALLLAFVAWRQFLLRFDTITIAGNKLRHETGMTSKSTRTLELVKVQDVRVDQTLVERMLGLGTIRIETAGDSIPLIMKGVEAPQQVADFILESARK